MKSERVPLRWLVVRCLVVWLGLLLLFGWVGCATFLAVAKFSSTFCFVRNNLEHFLALSFCAAVRKREREKERERMWAAGGNTQYKSHLDLCHAFNWLLCRCRCRCRLQLQLQLRHPLSSPTATATARDQAQAQQQQFPLAAKSSFGGGQKTKKHKCPSWMPARA